MTRTIVRHLAGFAVEAEFDRLPASVIEETKRLALDSAGCALAAGDSPKGRAGIEYEKRLGGSNGPATIIGTADRVSPNGVAFANGELINTFDYDAVLPPGHVTPYVLPGCLAAGDERGISGRTLIVATAVAHEMSYRIGKAMDYLRDTKDGKVAPPEVYGCGSTIFGATAATAATARTGGLGQLAMEDALGIAASIAPVNSQIA